MVGRSKNGTRLILCKVILVSEIYLTKLPLFDPMLQKYSASAFQNFHGTTGTRYIFFYIFMLVVSVTIASSE